MRVPHKKSEAAAKHSGFNKKYILFYIPVNDITQAHAVEIFVDDALESLPKRKGQAISTARALVGLTVEARHGRKAALGETQYLAYRDILRLARKAVAALESARSFQNPVTR